MLQEDSLDFDPRDLHKSVTIDGFLSNPMGEAGQSMITKRAMDATLHSYRSEYSSLRKSGKFKVVYYKNKDDIYLKVQVPSSTFEDFYYDVLFKFDTSKIKVSKLNTIPVQFFSNSPAFMFTYAYAFKLYSLLIPESYKLLNPKSIKQVPVVKNPDVTVFYEKTILFAIFYLKDANLLDTHNSLYHNSVVTALPRKIMDTIKSTESKLEEYNNRKKLMVEANKKERERIKKEKQKLRDTKKIKSDDNEFNKTINRVDKNTIKRRKRGPNKVKTSDNKVDMRVDNKVDMKV